jgi:hypothetical protein
MNTMNDPGPNPETRIALFQRKEVRRTIHNNEWWFVLTDVVAVLTGSVDAADYLKKLRKRDPSLAEALKGGGQIATPLAKLPKGGDNLSPPLPLSSTQRADASCSSAGTPRQRKQNELARFCPSVDARRPGGSSRSCISFRTNKKALVQGLLTLAPSGNPPPANWINPMMPHNGRTVNRPIFPNVKGTSRL